MERGSPHALPSRLPALPCAAGWAAACLKRADAQLVAALGGACDAALLHTRLEQLRPADVPPQLHAAWQQRLQQPPVAKVAAKAAIAAAAQQQQQQLQQTAGPPASQPRSSSSNSSAGSHLAAPEPLLINAVVAASGLGSAGTSSNGSASRQLVQLSAPTREQQLEAGWAAELGAATAAREVARTRSLATAARHR